MGVRTKAGPVASVNSNAFDADTVVQPRRCGLLKFCNAGAQTPLAKSGLTQQGGAERELLSSMSTIETGSMASMESAGSHRR